MCRVVSLVSSVPEAVRREAEPPLLIEEPRGRYGIPAPKQEPYIIVLLLELRLGVCRGAGGDENR